MLRYFPAYSPDFNPIELSFHLLKQWMRRHSAMAPEYGTENYEEKFEAFLRAAVCHFQEGVDHTGLFKKCYIAIEKEAEADS